MGHGQKPNDSTHTHRQNTGQYKNMHAVMPSCSIKLFAAQGERLCVISWILGSRKIIFHRRNEHCFATTATMTASTKNIHEKKNSKLNAQERKASGKLEECGEEA